MLAHTAEMRGSGCSALTGVLNNQMILDQGFSAKKKMSRRILDLGSLSKALGRKANFSQWREILVQWHQYWKKKTTWQVRREREREIIES